MHRLSFRVLSLVLLYGLLSAFFPTPSASAIGSSVVVNTTADNTTDNGQCSLREALQALTAPANDDCGTLSSPLVITFAPSVGTIKLNAGDVLPNINADKIVTITGPVIIDGRGSGQPNYGNFIVFDVKSGGILNLANLTITKAFRAINADSGAIINIAGVSFLDNGDPTNTSFGGAINAAGADTKINIAGSLFTANRANDSGSGSGGAIFTGAISNLNIGGSIFTGNTAKLSGGAISSNAKNINILDSIFNGNIANADDNNDDAYNHGGGAIYYGSEADENKLTILRSIFNGNITSEGSGGAVFVNSEDSLVEIRSSSFNGNLAGLPPSTKTAGGAIYTRGKTTIAQSTILNNAVVGFGGGIANDRRGELTLANTSVIANAATDAGGGLFNKTTQQGSSIYPSARVLNTTFALNVAGPAGGQGGGLINDADPAKLQIGNTIVTGSDGAALGGNCVGASQSLGNNLDSGTSCGWTQAGNLQNANANLAAPFFNGGPISTLLSMEPQAGSAAIDAGSNALCADPAVNNEDQAGRSRPKDGGGNGVNGCDIGALENDAAVAGFGSIPPAPGPIIIGTAIVNTSISGEFEVFNEGSAKLTVSSGTLGGANAGDFQVTTAFPFDIVAGGANKPIAITCTPSAVGVRTATLTLATNDTANTSVQYTLLCTGVAQPTPGFGSDPIAPGPLNYSAVNLGSSKVISISVQEIGSATLTVNNMQLGGENPGDFSIPPGLTLNIADGGAAQLIPVTCAPTTTGPRIATLTVATNDPGKPSVVFNLVCTGRIPPTPPLDTVGTSIAENNGLFGIAVSPDGRHIYVTAQTSDQLHGFRRNANNTLTSIDTHTNLFGGITRLDRPRFLVVSPDGKNVYVAASDGDAILTFDRNIETGVLTYRDQVFEGENYGCQILPCDGQVDGLTDAYGIAISPDGRFVYATSASAGSAEPGVAIFRRNQTTGSLRSYYIFPFVGDDPNFVGVFRTPTVNHLEGGRGIAISPDGQNVYLTGFTNDRLVVASRDLNTGLLTFEESWVDGQLIGAGPVFLMLNGLDAPFKLAVSPDGAQVYVASQLDDGVSIFRRDPSKNGKLSYGGIYRNGSGDITGMDNLIGLALTPNGKHLFTTADLSNAVAVFERDTTTGLLDFAQAVGRGAPPPPFLGDPIDIAVSPDSRTVYVTADGDNRVVVLPFANPRPELTALLPSSAKAGSPQFKLTVTGKNFVPNSVIRWNGVDQATTFVNDGELRAVISADKIANPEQVSVTVRNPTPGGGTSNPLIFTIVEPDKNPLPSLRELVPNSATVGGPAFVLQVRGESFVNGAKVRWNGSERPTTFISDEIVEATIAVADIATVGTTAVTVQNPGPGGGISNALAFEIISKFENPKPFIKQLIPASAQVGTATQIDLIIQGQNFVEGAVARWNGEDRPTDFVSETEVRMSVSGADLLTPGDATVVVVNPEPGGGVSNSAAFKITALGQNPVPGVAGIAVTGAGGGKLTLTITGTGFVGGATVIWNGKTLVPSSVSNTQIVVQVDITDFRSAVVSVVNPGPGGGSSTGLLISIVRSYIPFSVKP